MVYVTAGARSRDAVDANGIHTGKAPTQMADLKSGIIALRANAAVLPGDKERIISVGNEAAIAEEQTKLLNATHILLGTDGLTAAHPAKYWRHRSGTADQHTSFSIGYNICLAAAAKGLHTDYHLVWDMEHGSREGTSTGTFIDWIKSICQ